LTPDLIRAALLFLQRTDIKGGEAMAMVQVVAALEALARAPAQSTGALVHRSNGETATLEP
jgi:hypothetical protein